MKFQHPIFKIVLSLFIFIAFLLSLNLVLNRLSFEKNNRLVNTIAYYEDLKSLSLLSNTRIEDTLPQFSPFIQTIALHEMTLNSYIEEGKATVLKGSEIMNMYRVGHLNRHLLTYLYKQVKVQPDNFYLIIDQKEDYERIRDFLLLEFGKGRITQIQRWNIIEVIDMKKDLFDIGYGISKEKIDLVTSAGFKPAFIFKNSQRLSAPLIRLKLSTIQTHIDQCLFLFEGKSILGYPSDLIPLENKINYHQIGVANIEFFKPLGFQSLATQIPYHLIKTHLVPSPELGRYNFEKLVLRYVRSIKERGVHAIVVKPFLNQHDKRHLLAKNLTYFKHLHQSILDIDYSVSSLTKLSFDHFKEAKSWEIIIISIGVFSALIFLLSYFFMIHSLFLTFSYLFFFIACGFLYFFDELSLLSIGMSLIGAITIPSLAIISQFPSQIDHSHINQRLFASIFYFFSVIVITLVGCILIVALSSDIYHIQSIERFIGVKLAYFLPIVIIGLYFFLRPERLSSTFYVFKRIFFAPVRTVSLFAIIFCLVFIIFLILRSGHFFDILILDFEQSLRLFFESHLFVRPRIKEILIGYPFLLFTFMYIDKLISRHWLWFFLILGSVAPISIVNSFCHIHTPIFVTFYRTILGFLLGIMFGFIYLFIFKILSQFFHRTLK